MAAKKKTNSRTTAKRSSKRPAKKAITKRSKKSPAAKKRPAKRAAKKAARRKKAAKKSIKKSAVRKSTAKESAVKKPAKKKSARKKSTTKRASDVQRTSTSTLLVRDALPTRVGEYKLSAPTQTPTAAPIEEAAERKRLRLFLFIALGGLIALVLATTLNNDSTNQVSPEPTPVESPSESASSSATATPSESEEPAVVRLSPPENVYADYTPIGGRVTWQAPQGDTQPTQYLVKASFRGQGFKTIATLSATKTKLELIKVDTPSETVFKVVAVYPEGEAESDISSIKGRYEVNG